MDVHATLEAPCTPAALFVYVDDLAHYPAWTDLVHLAEPCGLDDGRPLWQVELRARMGPLARSKRLRMMRVEHDSAACRAVFERCEVDGRRHSPWVLRAEVSAAGAGSVLHMHLHYGGALWTGGLMERVLADQITSGRERLLALVRSTH
jgi:hypothetical protein